MTHKGRFARGLLSASAVAWTVCAGVATAADPPYTPAPVFCANLQSVNGASPLCSVIPGDIGPDPALRVGTAYNGLPFARPESAARDPQSPFDNLSWQTFVALNWAYGKETQPPAEGLRGDGNRVWQGWKRVSELFGNGKVMATCANPRRLPVFAIATNGAGAPVGQNEEFIQAATGDPLIDVDGNWTIYERRVNGVEEAYLRAPEGHAEWTLTTASGQAAFIKHAGKPVSFPSENAPTTTTGAMEVKAAWRVLDPAMRAANQQKYLLIQALLTVPPDLVRPSTPGVPPRAICDTVDLGLVAMHIIQKNPTPPDEPGKPRSSLKPEWFWSTFEHADNAPLAKDACDPAEPGRCPLANRQYPKLNHMSCPIPDSPAPAAYAYFNPDCPGCGTNLPPIPDKGDKYYWNQVRPYAQRYMTNAVRSTPSGSITMRVGTQVSRCWAIYELTDELNQKWRAELKKVNSVFQNYILVGTQWGGSITNTPDPKIPGRVVPPFLSNAVIETYLQTFVDEDPFNTGSCVTCHRIATLSQRSVLSDLSFLPELVRTDLKRRLSIAPRP